MNKKIYDPFKKMNKKQLSQMASIDADSRNLKDKKENGAGNFLHIHSDKKAS